MDVALDDGAALHVHERGEGGTPLLLIAGIPAVADDWDVVAEAAERATGA